MHSVSSKDIRTQVNGRSSLYMGKLKTPLKENAQHIETKLL